MPAFTHLACPTCRAYCAICGKWLDESERQRRTAPEECNTCREFREENGHPAAARGNT